MNRLPLTLSLSLSHIHTTLQQQHKQTSETISAHWNHTRGLRRVHWPRVVKFLQALPPHALIGRCVCLFSTHTHIRGCIYTQWGKGLKPPLLLSCPSHKPPSNPPPPDRRLNTPKSPPKPPLKKKADIGCGDGKYLALRRYHFHPTAFAVGCDRSLRLLACAARQQGGGGEEGKEEPIPPEVFACDVLQVCES